MGNGRSWADRVRLAARRRSVGLTQRDLALRARIDRVHYWRIEHGRCDPTPRVAARIEAALRGSVEWARVADHGPVWQRGMRGVLRREEAPLPWMERDAWVCLDLVGPGPAGRYWFPVGDVAIG